MYSLNNVDENFFFSLLMKKLPGNSPAAIASQLSLPRVINDIIAQYSQCFPIVFDTIWDIRKRLYCM